MRALVFRRAAIVTLIAVIGAAPAIRVPNATARCESLTDARLPNVTINVAAVVTGGSFTPPGSQRAITGLPDFCRVAGVIRPTSTSEIAFETWLPLEKWNQKFSAVGNGGWAGTITFNQLAEQIRRGYATAGSNTGHEAGQGMDQAKFAFTFPERFVDFAWRSEHETTVAAKAIVTAFYGDAPQHSYWIGCSTGGKQGLTEAQRFPADFDGIVAGAPANNWTRLMAGTLDMVLAASKDSVAFLPPPALAAIARAAVATCDAIDGVTDGLINDPRRCRFDPGSIECSSSRQAPDCLSHAQVEAARRIYRGARDPQSGAQIYPGLEPGSEMGWGVLNPANPFVIPLSHFRWVGFRDSTWNWKSFDWARASDARVALDVGGRIASVLNATNPDLDAFRARGGKLIQYHGWADMLIAPRNSIDYYTSVVNRLAAGRAQRDALADVDRFYRLFMAPGAGHCAGGDGPSVFDAQTALEQWVESGVAPDKILATHATSGVVDRSRPLCPYPKVAVYSGTGDSNDAANFSCREQ